MPIHLKNNFSLLAAENVRQIVTHFLKKMNLTYFIYGRYYNNGYRFHLTNREDWTEHYYQMDYPNIAKLERHPSCYTSCFMLWDHWDKDCISYKTVMKDFDENFNIAHGLSIIKRNSSDYYDGFDFGTTRDNHTASSFYLSNIDLFEHFSLYFTEKAKSLIKQANKDKFLVSYDKKIDIYTEYPDTLAHAKKLKILDKYSKPILSDREMSCINFLLKGNTVSDLAIFLNISQRTVEKHIINIKQKLDCKTLFQLGTKISNLGLDKISIFMPPSRNFVL